MKGVYIIIPTYNEAENIKTVISKINNLNGSYHIVVVDDNSPDGTAGIAQNMNQAGNIHVQRRSGKLGIGSAIRDGMKLALSFPDCQYLITMDADLSHAPEDIPMLLAEASGADLVQGSRYVRGGKIIGWNLYRKVVSWTANFLYRNLFRLGQHEITTYFRVYSRECAEIIVKNVTTDSYEFGFASALVIHDHKLSVKEVPIVFTNREQGKSKLKTSDIFHSVRYLLVTFITRLLRNADIHRFIKFCAVGASGIVVNQGFLWFFTDIVGLYYLYSALISIEASILSNFILNDLWTFRDIKILAGPIFQRFLRYNLLCIAGAILNYVILWLLTDFAHLHYLISNLCGIAAAVTWNYLISLKWAWQRKLPGIPPGK